MSRTKGAKDKIPRSPARLAACRANSRLPRPKLSKKAVRTLSEAKEELAKGLAGPGVKGICAMILLGEQLHSKRIKIEDPELRREVREDFKFAVTFAADRAGMPRRNELDVDANGEGPLLIRVQGGLGWPGADGDVGGVGGDSSSDHRGA